MHTRHSLTSQELYGLLALFSIAYANGAFADGRWGAVAKFSLPVDGDALLFEEAAKQLMRSTPRHLAAESALWAMHAMGLVTLLQKEGGGFAEDERWAATLLGMQVALTNAKERWAFAKSPRELSDSAKRVVNQALGCLGEGLRFD